MRVLKVTAEGLTTSFRYPHFMQQIHPSFPMPPPATIYGLICGTLGYWFDPTGTEFAYRFTHEGKVRDVEHTIVLRPSGGFLPGTKTPKVLEGNVNPFEREILFRPRLTLYMNRPEWEAAFRSPRYAVALGRSQDLLSYTRVELVDLDQCDHAYFEHTILPHDLGLRTVRGVTVTMPRYVDYERDRTPVFSRYVIIADRVSSSSFFEFGDTSNGPYWVDPTAPEVLGSHLGLSFLSFTGADGDWLESA